MRADPAKGSELELLVHTVALIGLVIVVAALLSGIMERRGFPQVLVFLLLGAVLGPAGLRLISFTLDSGSLRVVATLGLVLVLFSDAVGVDIGSVKEHRKLVGLVLGPGTLVSAALIAVAAWRLLGCHIPEAAIIGAALASTDPVMMRGLLRREEVPPAARQALRFESGVNDVVLLPVVLIAMAFMTGGGAAPEGGWARPALSLLILGPGAGIAVGLVGIAVLEFVRKRFSVRRDYESLYALGLAFTAYATAEYAHGSGFLAAFAAGLTIASLDVELCDCFLDYGQATAEMFLLLTFVAFGAGLIWKGVDATSGPVLVFALVALFVRSLVLWVSLGRVPIDAKSRALIVWFGPRGLSSLLLVLLPVFAGIDRAEELFPIAALVVLLSVVVHGAMLPILVRRQEQAPDDPAPPRSSSGVRDAERITIPELRRLEEQGIPVHLLDVRRDASHREDPREARGAIRVDPDRPVTAASELALPKDEWLAAYCT